MSAEETTVPVQMAEAVDEAEKPTLKKAATRAKANTRKRDKKNAVKKMNISTSHAILDQVKRTLNVDDEDAMRVLAAHVQSVLDYVSAHREKLFWSSIDTKALYTIVENKLITEDESNTQLVSLEAFEKWLASQNYTRNEQLVVDRAFFLLSFFFENHSLRGFTLRLRGVLTNYDKSQYELLERLLALASDFLQSKPLEETPDQFNRFMHQVVAEAAATAKGSVRKCIIKRLEFIRRAIENMKKELLEPASVPIPQETKADYEVTIPATLMEEAPCDHATEHSKKKKKKMKGKSASKRRVRKEEKKQQQV